MGIRAHPTFGRRIEYLDRRVWLSSETWTHWILPYSSHPKGSFTTPPLANPPKGVLYTKQHRPLHLSSYEPHYERLARTCKHWEVKSEPERFTRIDVVVQRDLEQAVLTVLRQKT